MSDKKECDIELELRANGTGTVRIDGQDVSNKVNRVELNAVAGKPTQVTLTLLAASVRVMGSAWVGTQLLTIDPQAERVPNSSEDFETLSNEEASA